MKQKTVDVAGHWLDDPKNTFDVTIALGEWDGECNAEDEGIFFYMDGEPVSVGMIISEGFVITEIYGEEA
jgi:hypothetical protein